MKRIVYRLLIAVAVLGSSTSKSATLVAAGQLRMSFNFEADDLIADPVRPRIYATVPATNSVAVIDTTTMSLVTTVFIGSNPRGMAISADNTKLFVANQGSTVNAIGVLDLATLTSLPSYSAPERPFDLAVGLAGRLYASSASGIQQFDTGSGTYVKTFPGYPNALSSGYLAITPDGNTLFDGSLSGSPARLQRFDVSTPNATLLQTQSFSRGGDTYQTLSHDGAYVVFVSGYAIDKLAANDLTAVHGTFNVGAYPSASTFSPDDKWFYAARSGGPTELLVFNANTYVQTGGFSLSGDPSALLVDNSGSYLFSAEPGKVQVYWTGVPEPGTLSCLLGGFALLTGCRRTGRVRRANQS